MMNFIVERVLNFYKAAAYYKFHARCPCKQLGDNFVLQARQGL